MKTFVLQFFTWWNGQTLGTRFHTWRNGVAVGTDEFGNRYYQTRRGDRRWVVYNGPIEPSAVPPGWNGWLHHTVDRPPVAERYEPRPWERPHLANPTGTPLAYRPRGSLLSTETRPRAADDYDAWSP